MKKIISYVIVICLILGISVRGVKAEIDSQYINTISNSGYSIEVNAETGKSSPALTMKLKYSGDSSSQQSVEDDEDDEDGDDGDGGDGPNEVYVIFVKNQSDARPDLNNYVSANATSCKLSGNSTLKVGNLNLVKLGKDVATSDVDYEKIFVNNDWYMVEGYNYAYVIETYLDSETSTYSCSITETPITVNKPELPDLNSRYQLFLFDNNSKYLEIFPYFPTLITSNGAGEHKLVTKIGIVNDDEVLKEYKNGNVDVLLNYAKNNDGQTWEYSDSASRIDLNNFTVTNGAYYFVYTTYTDSGNLYRNLDGINLVMGKDNMLVSDLAWNDDVDVVDTTGKAVTNPKTGNTSLIVILVSLFAVLFVGVYYVRHKAIINQKI